MKIQMQQSGGLLIAAEKDGGNTLVAVHSRTAKQINLAAVSIKKKGLVIACADNYSML